MKKFYLINILLISLLGTSCVDLLDKKPLDKISSDVVWEDPNLIDAYVIDLYERVIAGYFTFTNNSQDNWSDDLQIPIEWFIKGNEVVFETLTKSTDMGFNQYENIARINTLMQGVESASSLAPDFQSRVLGESYMFRAMVYHWMTRRFGDVMLVDKVLTPNDEMKLPRTPQANIYDFIISDLRKACEYLPENVDLGRLNKAAAHAYLIRVLLDARKYDDVIVESEKFIGEQNCYGHEIVTDYEGMFNDYQGKSSPEVIFSCFKNNSSMTIIKSPLQYILPGSNRERTEPWCDWSYINNSMYGWAAAYPTQQLVDEYEVIDNDGIAKCWWKTERWKNRDKNAPDNTAIMYQNRDLRFYSSIFCDGALFADSKYIMRYPYFPYRCGCSTNQMYALTGYLIKKGCPEYINNFSGSDFPIDYHWVILRLGEVYLNYAEALIRKGQLDKALTYINEVRTKHGGLPPVKTTDNLLDVYKRERRVDMFFEQDRYWSLLRWGKEENRDVIKELNENPDYIDISPDGSTYYIASVRGVMSDKYSKDYFGNVDYFENPQKYGNPVATKTYDRKSPLPNRSFTKKRYLFPVPQSHIDANPNLVQNKGWE